MAIDKHLVDMIILYMALANGTSEAGVSALTLHSETMMWLSKIFLDTEWQVRKAEGGASIIKVEGTGLRNLRIQV
jgi:RNA 3'-terminal phosphate cyclase